MVEARPDSQRNIRQNRSMFMEDDAEGEAFIEAEYAGKCEQSMRYSFESERGGIFSEGKKSEGSFCSTNGNHLDQEGNMRTTATLNDDYEEMKSPEQPLLQGKSKKAGYLTFLTG